MEEGDMDEREREFHHGSTAPVGRHPGRRSIPSVSVAGCCSETDESGKERVTVIKAIMIDQTFSRMVYRYTLFMTLQVNYVRILPITCKETSN